MPEAVTKNKSETADFINDSSKKLKQANGLRKITKE